MPPLPQLEGLTSRFFRDASDYPHFVRIINAAARGEGSDRVETPEGITAASAGFVELRT